MPVSSSHNCNHFLLVFLVHSKTVEQSPVISPPQSKLYLHLSTHRVSIWEKTRAQFSISPRQCIPESVTQAKRLTSFCWVHCQSAYSQFITLSKTSQAKPKFCMWKETCAKCKSTSSCLLAIPVFHLIAGLNNRYLNYNRGN